jgi:hypothetical protein
VVRDAVILMDYRLRLIRAVLKYYQVASSWRYARWFDLIAPSYLPNRSACVPVRCAA